MTHKQWQEFGLHAVAGQTQCRFAFDSDGIDQTRHGIIMEVMPFSCIDKSSNSWTTYSLKITWFNRIESTDFPVYLLEFLVNGEWKRMDEIVKFEDGEHYGA
jgi:hypothetical protein